MDLSFHTIFDELNTRLARGPLHFRLIVQPTMAALLGVRAGLADAKAGLPPFIWGLVFRRVGNPQRLEVAFRHLIAPILIATILDSVVQYMMFGHVHPLAALIVGTVLMAVPYSAARGVSNRIGSRILSAREQRR